MYWVAYALLLVLFVIGQVAIGAARWISTGLFNIQPSEIAKIVMIIVLAAYFSKS
jgi:rod shape determining protein RodA